MHAEVFERRDVERLHAQLLKSIEKDSSNLSVLEAKYDEDTPCVRHIHALCFLLYNTYRVSSWI